MRSLNFLLVLIGLASPAFSYNFWSEVQQCPSGKYPECPAYFNSASTSTETMSTMPTKPNCNDCPAGTATSGSDYFNTWYSNNNYGCQRCWTGYANETGSTTCKTCPEGYQCSDPALTPKICPKGTAFSLVWTEGDLYGGSASGCSPCPPGTYNLKEGAIQCTACPAGKYCPNRDSDPVPCPIGTVTNLPNSDWSSYSYQYQYYNQNNLRCKHCPMGFVATAPGSTQCTMCPEGSYCPDPTRIIKCPIGTYRNNLPNPVTYPLQKLYLPGTISITCFPCPQGYYANTEGSKTCTKCGNGFMCPDPTTNLQKPCPVGTFSSSKYGSKECLPCPDGFYANTTGNTQCKVCPDGSQCTDPTVGPKKCPLGTYSNSKMVKILCAQCPPGTYANATGMTFCYNCPDSMCCDDPTSNPTPCSDPSIFTTAQPVYLTS